MSTISLLTGFSLAFLTALILTPIVSWLALRQKWVDIPDGKRAMHRRPTPRAGGIAIVSAFLLGIAYFYLLDEDLKAAFGFDLYVPSMPFILGAIAMALTGLYDDAYGLGFKKKFFFQLLVAYLMFVAGFRVEVSSIPLLGDDPYIQASLALPLTLLWYVAVINAVNLIDGLDGLAGGITLIAFGSLALVFSALGDLQFLPIALVIAGAIAGFLVHNFSPATIFMGDSGSLFLGFMLATYTLTGTSHENPVLALIIPILAVGFPLLDTSVAFVRRILNGQSPFAPDKDHIHHRLIETFKMTVPGAVLLLYALNAALGLMAIMLVVVDARYFAVIVALAALVPGVLLRKLGYLRFRIGFQQVKRLLKNRLTNHVPRGQWQTSEEKRGAPHDDSWRTDPAFWRKPLALPRDAMKPQEKTSEKTLAEE
ncbi:MAG: MraY family glycosyltransferase [Rhodothermales bacterium]|nr:MraY family glycosyltransferase [Rhodothermales bacterium]